MPPQMSTLNSDAKSRREFESPAMGSTPCALVSKLAVLYPLRGSLAVRSLFLLSAARRIAGLQKSALQTKMALLLFGTFVGKSLNGRLDLGNRILRRCPAHCLNGDPFELLVGRKEMFHFSKE